MSTSATGKYHFSNLGKCYFPSLFVPFRNNIIISNCSYLFNSVIYLDTSITAFCYFINKEKLTTFFHGVDEDSSYFVYKKKAKIYCDLPKEKKIEDRAGN